MEMNNGCVIITMRVEETNESCYWEKGTVKIVCHTLPVLLNHRCTWCTTSYVSILVTAKDWRSFSLSVCVHVHSAPNPLTCGACASQIFAFSKMDMHVYGV